MLADKDAAAARLAALKATFDEDVKAAQACIREMAEVEKEFRPLHTRATAFFASSTWSKLWAASPSETKNRASSLSSLLDQLKFSIEATPRTLKEQLAAIRGLGPAALGEYDYTANEIRRTLRSQLGHPADVRSRMKEAVDMLTRLAAYVEKHKASTPAIVATIVSPEVLDQRERNRPSALPTRADGDFDPRGV